MDNFILRLLQSDFLKRWVYIGRGDDRKVQYQRQVFRQACYCGFNLHNDAWNFENRIAEQAGACSGVTFSYKKKRPSY